MRRCSASTANYKWTPNLIWFNPRDVMYTPNYFVQQMFAGNMGRYVLNDVETIDRTNAGGLLVGAHATAVEVYEVRVKDIATGKLVYKHNFKDGMAGWKLYPRCVGGELRGGALYIGVADALQRLLPRRRFFELRSGSGHEAPRRCVQLYRGRRRQGRGGPRHNGLQRLLHQLPSTANITRGTTFPSTSASTSCARRAS